MTTSSRNAKKNFLRRAVDKVKNNNGSCTNTFKRLKHKSVQNP